MWLIEAKIINPCFNATDPNIGLSMTGDYSSFKLYMADTGLLLTLALKDNENLRSIAYKNLLLNDLNINQGMFAENVVTQQLISNNHKLFFYSKVDRENTDNTMEIDFIVTNNQKLVPIEVKSGSYRSVRSLVSLIINIEEELIKK